MSLIEVRDLRKVYASEGVETMALEGISLTINSGEFVAIMGPSGSGKSTLLHILGLLDRPTSGTYHFADKEINAYSENELAHIRNSQMGFVFQSFNLLSRTSVLDNVRLPLFYSSVPEKEWTERAVAAIESVGLAHRMDHHPSQLSGGEKQRAAIARALVNNPQVIFADEPTGNLDSRSGQMVMETIQDLNQTHHHTIVLITHETYTAGHAERIIHIKDGTVDKLEKVVDRHIAAKSFVK